MGYSSAFDLYLSAISLQEKLINEVLNLVKHPAKINTLIVIKFSASYRISKRILDITISCFLLLVLSPLLLLVAILIKIESRGPIFYASKRVGQNYKVFNFWKFRSMRSDADILLKTMKIENQYVNSEEKSFQVASDSERTRSILVHDEGTVEEDDWLIKDSKTLPVFVKIQNDPRITLVGHFLRNTSIDELPQLFNILKGDMSLVGNRPLPLYEAELLTTDDAIARFIAPAGLTGLWQVTERGKVSVSSDNRKKLDVAYAKRASFLLDVWILFKTPLAAFQSSNV